MNKGKTLFELVVGLFIIGILFSIISIPISKLFYTIPIVYSEGERTGEIVKFSKKGLLFKTWEGELNTGRIQDGSLPVVWQFSVRDPAIIKAIHDAQESGKRVTLCYYEYLLVAYRDGETDYLIWDLKFPKEKK